MFCGNAAGKFISPWWFINQNTVMKIGQEEAIATQCMTVWQMGGLTHAHLKHGFSNNLFQALGKIKENKWS